MMPNCQVHLGLNIWLASIINHCLEIYQYINASTQLLCLTYRKVRVEAKNDDLMIVSRRRQCWSTPVLLPGESHGWRSLVGCSPWGREQSDTTERLHFHFSLSCIEEVTGNPCQCSCLENPRDGGAWWAAVHGATQSWTRLKRLSSNSSQVAAGAHFCFDV